MSAYDAMFNEDLAFAEADLPQAVTIAGTDYPAVVSDLARGESLEIEATYSDRAISVTMRTEVLAIPAIGTLLTYKAETFRVLSRSECMDGVSYRLDCDAVHK